MAGFVLVFFVFVLLQQHFSSVMHACEMEIISLNSFSLNYSDGELISSCHNINIEVEISVIFVKFLKDALFTLYIRNPKKIIKN